MMRTCLIVFASLGVFWFPWPLAAALIMVIGFLFPPAALVLGASVDLMFHPLTHGAVPYGLVVGVCACVLGYLVRRYVGSRIMSA